MSNVTVLSHSATMQDTVNSIQFLFNLTLLPQTTSVLTVTVCMCSCARTARIDHIFTETPDVFAILRLILYLRQRILCLFVSTVWHIKWLLLIKVNSMQTCLNPAFFSVASGGRLHGLQNEKKKDKEKMALLPPWFITSVNSSQMSLRSQSMVSR